MRRGYPRVFPYGLDGGERYFVVVAIEYLDEPGAAFREELNLLIICFVKDLSCYVCFESAGHGCLMDACFGSYAFVRHSVGHHFGHECCLMQFVRVFAGKFLRHCLPALFVILVVYSGSAWLLWFLSVGLAGFQCAYP